MNCSSCGVELSPGAARCPACETAVAPVVEGALAADPRLVTPPARARGRADAAGAALREPAILRRREPREQREQREERSWRDEVQERVRSRRQKRVGGAADLPLFEQPSLSPALPTAAELTLRVPSRASGPARSVEALVSLPEPTVGEPAAEMRLRPEAQPRVVKPSAPAPPAPAEAPLSAGLTEAELADLPLRTTVPAAVDSDFVHEPDPPVELPAPPPAPWQARPAAGASADLLVVHSDPHDALELEPPPSEPDPLERPARALERAQAAAFDLALFTALSGVAVYFASRAARVEVLALVEGWPWISAFLGLLAVFYACYFTGTTGQTPGKLLLGLRVVDVAGRRPSYPVATARALVGLLGIALAGLGLLPMAFDPARRAAHDRAFHTRVVRR